VAGNANLYIIIAYLASTVSGQPYDVFFGVDGSMESLVFYG
jgi:hypothetical protein